jgi:hypothetical protein
MLSVFRFPRFVFSPFSIGVWSFPCFRFPLSSFPLLLAILYPSALILSAPLNLVFVFRFHRFRFGYAPEARTLNFEPLRY